MSMRVGGGVCWVFMRVCVSGVYVWVCVLGFYACVYVCVCMYLIVIISCILFFSWSQLLQL